MKKMSRKKKIVTILSCVLIVLLAAGTYIYLKGPRHYNYEEIPGGIDVISDEDSVRFCVNFSIFGETDYTGRIGKEQHEMEPENIMTIPGMELLYMDEETGLPCYRVFVRMMSSPWDMEFHREYKEILASPMTHDGIPLGYINKNGELKCDHRVVEFCYLNRDGSYVTLWTLGDTP